MIGMTLLVMRAMRTLLSLVAASPPSEPVGRSERPFRLAQHQRRPQRRQEQPQAVPKGREERNEVSTAALLMEGAEDGAIGGAPEMGLEARGGSLPNSHWLVGAKTHKQRNPKRDV